MKDHLDVRPGVAAVVRNAMDEVLLHWRPIGRGWAPPSGRLEAGETVHDAVIRELQEETRLTVHIEGLIGVYSDPRYQIVTYPGGRRVHFVTNLFACRVTGGVLAGSDEGASWAWFEPHRLPEDLLPYARVWLADALVGRAHAILIR